MPNIINAGFTGLHIVGQLSQCSTDSLQNESGFNNLAKMLIVQHDLQSLGSVIHSFESGGFTAIFCLSESHIAVHTWPELQYVTLDVFLCNYSRSNNERCKSIFQAIVKHFMPGEISSQEIYR